MNSSSRSNDDGVSIIGVGELNLSLMMSLLLDSVVLLKDEELEGLRPRWWCFDRFVLAGELPGGDGEIGRLCLRRRECLFSWSDREVVGLEGERSPSGDSSGAELLTLSERWAWRWSNSR